MTESPIVDLEALRPARVRLSILLSDAQVDVSLPVDVPIAGLIPALTDLAATSRKAMTNTRSDAVSENAARDLLELRRLEGGPALNPDITFREAGVVDGTLLRLDARRALTPPMLHDDVVDAAARINRQGNAGWNAVAARRMAFVAVNLTTLALAYLTIAPAFDVTRMRTLALSTVVVLTLAGAATLAHRFYGLSDAATALGWAAIPLLAAVAWSAPTGYGEFGLAAKCAVTIAVLATLYFVIGTGVWAYLAGGIAFALTAAALTVHAAGVGLDTVGVGMTAVGLIGCLRVRELTAHRSRFEPLTAPDGKDIVMTDGPSDGDEASDVYATVRSAATFRAGLYSGLATGVAAGAYLVASAPGPALGSGLVFAWCCAGTLGSYARRMSSSAVECAALGVPALALWIGTCVLGEQAPLPMPALAFGALLSIAVSFPIARLARARHARSTTALAYVDYLLPAALIPVTCWVLGSYQRMGIV